MLYIYQGVTIIKKIISSRVVIYNAVCINEAHNYVLEHIDSYIEYNNESDNVCKLKDLPKDKLIVYEQFNDFLEGAFYI